MTPRRDDWPVYDEGSDKFVDAASADTRVSMLDLTSEEAASLEIVKLFCDYKRQYGKSGRAPTFKYRKLSVVRAEWKRHSIVEHLPTPRARAAYAWLCQHNKTYAD